MLKYTKIPSNFRFVVLDFIYLLILDSRHGSFRPTPAKTTLPLKFECQIKQRACRFDNIISKFQLFSKGRSDRI